MSPLRCAALVALLSACKAPAPAPPDDSHGDTESRVDTDVIVDTDVTIDTEVPAPWPWSDTPCTGWTPLQDYSAQFARWNRQGPPDGDLLLVGSSSIRRWETATRALAPWGVVQRGHGGALLRNLVAVQDDLLPASSPRAVLLFAGTNDVASGATADDIVRAYRCFVEQIADRYGPTPVYFLGITPTPSRWSTWPLAAATNEGVAQLADRHPLLHYVDIPAPFLAQGEPPPDELFVADKLHLSASGYALWTDTLLAALADLPHRAVPPSQAPDTPAYVRVDLGPSNPEDGAAAPPVDGLGIHWNRWHDVDGNDQILAGEVLHDLVTTTGEPTGIDLVVAGGFRCNGRQNGGLAAPDGTLLGTLALSEATTDFFWTGDADDPGALTLTGLDPNGRYTLRLFASRASTDETRITRYTVYGTGLPQSTELVTTGAGVGAAGGDGNDSEVAVLSDLQPDAWGQLHLDVAIAQGSYAYLSLLELELR